MQQRTQYTVSCTMSPEGPHGDQTGLSTTSAPQLNLAPGSHVLSKEVKHVLGNEALPSSGDHALCLAGARDTQRYSPIKPRTTMRPRREEGPGEGRLCTRLVADTPLLGGILHHWISYCTNHPRKI